LFNSSGRVAVRRNNGIQGNDTRKAVRELERAIICFLEDYADVFPDMNINDGAVEIPVSSTAVWKLTMKIKTKKYSSEQ
jgi:DNA-binding MurR/RpiR family transcriptional regulator